jgi:pimeloyl-ACP methyl ester carboxylesterase
MKGYFSLVAIIGAASLAGKTAAVPHAELAPSNRSDSTCPLVLVVDGAGDLKGCSTALKAAAAQYQVSLNLETFSWSHGHYKLYQDQVDARHFRAKGIELAEHIAALRAKQPERPIVLVSHSAGCSVALAACEFLPPDSLERQVLLAPSVSTRYDLRPALRASKQGIDVFCSKKDRWALGLVIWWIGSADETHDGKASGRHGFAPAIDGPDDVALYRRLRHHFWSEADEKLGHDGRHHGMHAPAFVKEKVLPLFQIGR